MAVGEQRDRMKALEILAAEDGGSEGKSGINSEDGILELKAVDDKREGGEEDGHGGRKGTRTNSPVR